MEEEAGLAKTLSNTHHKSEGHFVRKDVSAKQKNLREDLKIIQYTTTSDFGGFHQGFAELTNIDINAKAGSPLFMNPDGSKTAHLHKDTGIVTIDNDGVLYSPVFTKNLTGQSVCHLEKDTTTLYCTGVYKCSIAGHDYEAIYKSKDDVEPVKKS